MYRFSQYPIRPLLRGGREFLWRRAATALAIAFALSACVTDISVTRHPDISLNTSEAQSILADFSAVVNTADSPTDIACATDVVGQFLPAYFFIDGTVGNHNGPGVINGQQDFINLLGEPGYAKVVSAINWCGDFGPNIIGCAPTPGDSFAVVRRSASLEGILWAHEFGHTVGLEHREDSGAVMSGTIGPNKRDITLAECEQFLGKVNTDYYLPGSSPALVRAVLPGEPLVLDSSRRLPVVSASLTEFVREVYPHGTPMSELVRMQAGGELPELRAMLARQEDSLYWGNVVVVLGIFGDASDVPTLIQFVRDQAQSVEVDGPGNAGAALMALGYLANRTGDPAALSFLTSRVATDAWTGAPEKRRQLAITAHIGMAFSGQPLVSPQAARSAAIVSPELSTRLRELGEAMASRGVHNYYRER